MCLNLSSAFGEEVRILPAVQINPKHVNICHTNLKSATGSASSASGRRRTTKWVGIRSWMRRSAKKAKSSITIPPVAGTASNSGITINGHISPNGSFSLTRPPSEPKPLFHPGDRVRVKQELKSPPRFKLRLSVRPTHLCKVGQTITIDKYDSSDDTYQERGSGLWWASEWLEPIEVKSDSADAGSRPQSLDESRVMSRTRAELEICCTHVPGVDTASRTPLINPTQLLTINNLD